MSLFMQMMKDDIRAVTERAERSLVKVSDGSRGAGSGVVWHSDGLIVTNAHVVQPGSQVILDDRRRLAARLLAIDRRLDVAALYIEASGLDAIEQGDSRNLRAGEFVFSVGHPWGVAGAFSAGTIVDTGGEWPERELSGREWIITDLHLRPGNSGGPLVDARGRLVGINTMTVGPNMGIALPAHVVERFLNMQGIRFNLERDWSSYGLARNAA
jgi:serine protease Do